MAVYACSDLHGMKNLLEQIMNFLQPDDKVYFLGDAADRGPHGWEMIKTIIDDPRFVYIKGNHEDMLVRAAQDYFRTGSYTSNFSLLRSNGGKITFHDMTNDPDAKDWISMVRGMSTYEVYKNAAGQSIFLSHAGISAWRDEDGDLLVPEDEEDLIWDRSHFLDEWNPAEMHEKVIVVHGHTPIPYIMDDLRLPDNGDLIEAGPLWYCNNHKVCLDCAAFATGAAFLLDLDTFESITIRDTD